MKLRCRPPKLAERIERLHHARALRPAAARAAGERNHGHRPARQRLHADLAISLRKPVVGVQHVARPHVVDVGADGRRFCARPMRPLRRSARICSCCTRRTRTLSSSAFETLRARRLAVPRCAAAGGRTRAAPCPPTPARAAGGAEAVELGAARGGQQPRLRAQQRRHRQRVIARRHQRVAAAQQLGRGAALVDGEIVDHRLHGERHGMFHAPLGRRS